MNEALTCANIMKAQVRALIAERNVIMRLTCANITKAQVRRLLLISSCELLCDHASDQRIHHESAGQTQVTHEYSERMMIMCLTCANVTKAQVRAMIHNCELIKHSENA